MYHLYKTTIQSVPIWCAQQVPSSFIVTAHILLVEDNVILQKIHQVFLEELGYAVTIVSSGEEALRVVHPGFDLVLMDIDLPGMSGILTAAALLRHVTLPIVACTTHTEVAIQQECFANGMVDYLYKPLVFEQLAACLQRHITPRHGTITSG